MLDQILPLLVGMRPTYQALQGQLAPSYQRMSDYIFKTVTRNPWESLGIHEYTQCHALPYATDHMPYDRAWLELAATSCTWDCRSPLSTPHEPPRYKDLGSTRCPTKCCPCDQVTLHSSTPCSTRHAWSFKETFFETSSSYFMHKLGRRFNL